MKLSDVTFASGSIARSEYFTTLLNHAKYGYDEAHYAECSTIASNSQKVIDLEEFFLKNGAPPVGSRIVMRLVYGNTAETMSLLITGKTSDYPIISTDYSLENDTLIEILFTGNEWRIVSSSSTTNEKVKKQIENLTSAVNNINNKLNEVEIKADKHFISCDYPDASVYKVGACEYIKTTNGIPNDGEVIYVRFVNGHTANNLYFKIDKKTESIPVMFVNSTVSPTDIQAGAVLELCYDAEYAWWEIIGGNGIKMPEVFLNPMVSMDNILSGNISHKALYDAIIGSGGLPKWRGQHLMIQFEGVYITLEHEKRMADYELFCCIRGGKFYEFKINSENYIVDTDGIEIITKWNE